jgi:hypothetical protein
MRIQAAALAGRAGAIRGMRRAHPAGVLSRQTVAANSLTGLPMDRPILSSELLSHGEQYLDSSDAVHRLLTDQKRYSGVPPLPTLHMIGGALEMLMKAFLLEHGESLRLLQSMDSDLERIRRRAVDMGLTSLVQFQGLEEAAIDLLGRHLVNRDLAFQRFASSSPPPYFLLRSAAGRLLPAVRLEIETRRAERTSLDVGLLDLE